MNRPGLARRSAAFVLGIWLAASLAGSALAAKPEREVLGPELPFTVSGVCDFDVEITDLKVGFAIMTFAQPDGSTAIIAAGQWLLRITNLQSGASMLTTISGPEFVSFDDIDFSDVGTGRWLIFDYGQGMYLTSGQMDLTGPTVSDWLATLRGSAVDVCAALAA